MRNNKFTRKRAAREAAKHIVVQQDGTEVIATKEARQKIRRWSYEAEITRVFAPTPGENGVAQQPFTFPVQRVKLDSISYGTVRQAKLEMEQHRAQLAEVIKLPSTFRVLAIPHETVSLVTVNQLNGYRDMAMILDKALMLSVQEAQDVVLGRNVGAHLVETPAVEATDSTPAVPARTLATIKEDYYKRALDSLKPKPEEVVTAPPVDAAVTLTDDGDEERSEFVPEIVDIQRSA